MVGAERFVTPELKDVRGAGAHAPRSAAAPWSSRLFEELRARVLQDLPALKAAAEAIATLDALLSFARVAAEHGYCRPRVDASGSLEIVGGRHPVVERLLRAEPFVPNDVRLACDPSARCSSSPGPTWRAKAPSCGRRP